MNDSPPTPPQADAPGEPLLAVGEIQGNVLPGFMKPSLQLCAMRIVDVPAAKRWIAELTGRITTLAETLDTRERVRALRRQRDPGLLREVQGAIPEEVDDAWANISFSHSGLAKLLADGPHAEDLERFEDPAFRLGLAARSSLLGDPTDSTAEGHPDNWVVGKTGEELDVLLCIGADRAAAGAELLRDLRGVPETTGMVPLYEQDGERLDGTEHFGFQDGVSQPGVRGLTGEGAFLTPRTIAPTAEPEHWLYGLPGQLLTWPGDYVFGYPASGADPRAPGPVAAVGPNAPAWTRNGSYFAFRRFRQDVAGFWAFLTEQAKSLSGQRGFQGWDAERLAAHLLGRWKSGAPLLRSPETDDPDLGRDRFANNDFGFAAPSVSLPLVEGGHTNRFPMAPADPIGATCPLASHIRKVNARTSGGDMGGRKASFQRRILRRGLPWGTPLENPLEPDPSDDGQRGLLFLSYQASIARQFEFLSTSWMGSPTNPRSPGGFDMWVGQNGEPGQGRERAATLLGKGFEAGGVATKHDYVIPTGGEYFFTPSLSALREVITAE